MARIVEFMGSPGVGKTTLYKELEARWKTSRNWMPAQYFYPERIFANPGISVLNVFRQLKDRKSKVDIEAVEKAGQRFVELYPEYIEELWGNINCIQKKNLYRTDLRFQKVFYLYRLFGKVQTLRESNINKLGVIDEGLIHVIPSILDRKETPVEDEEEIEKLLQMMPLPAAVVSIGTDIQENVKRLMQRSKVIPMHKSLIDDQLERFTRLDQQRRAIVNKVVKRKDIPLLAIDSTNKIANNVSKIISFVEKL